jgi:hypothetical protein
MQHRVRASPRPHRVTATRCTMDCTKRRLSSVMASVLTGGYMHLVRSSTLPTAQQTTVGNRSTACASKSVNFSHRGPMALTASTMAGSEPVTSSLRCCEELSIKAAMSRWVKALHVWGPARHEQVPIQPSERWRLLAPGVGPAMGVPLGVAGYEESAWPTHVSASPLRCQRHLEWPTCRRIAPADISRQQGTSTRVCESARARCERV